MDVNRRTAMLAAGAALGGALAGSSARGAAPARAAIRRIAVEEAWSIPEHMNALGALARSSWTNLDIRQLEGASERSENGVRLIDVEDERLRRMDEDGVAMQVLSLTSPGVQVFDPDTAVAMAALANDRLAETIARHPARFAGLASFAPQDPGRAVREMERAIGRLKLNGFIVNSHTENAYLDQPRFWPILEAAEALDAPIYIHPRSPADTIAQPFRDYAMHAAIWGFAIETGTHAMRLILSGVFDRFPKLRIVLGHMGENIPFHLWRSDHWFDRRRSIQRSSLKPSEVFRRNFAITTSGVQHSPALRYAIEVVGADSIMFAIDYPYEESRPAVAFMDSVDISEEDRAKIYHRNAERLFRLPPEAA